MTTTHNQIPKEEFSEYIKALKDYKSTGYRQSMSIIQMLKEAKLTPTQLNEFHPTAWYHFIGKLSPESKDEEDLKEAMRDLLDKLQSRHREMTSTSLHKMKEGSLGNSIKKHKDSEKENLVFHVPEKTGEKEQPGKGNKEGEGHSERIGEHHHQHHHHSQKDEKHVHAEGDQGHEQSLDPKVKDFTVKTLSEELLADYKTKKQEKKDIVPLAEKKAQEIEEAIEEETEGDEEKFRMEARNVSAFLAVKKNDELRKGLLSGDIDVQEFVTHKEDFLNPHIKAVAHQKEREAFNEGNLDRDVEIVPDSELYKCGKCGSRKIKKTEKQMKLGDEPSTSVLVCAECDHVELIEG